jgi:mannose-6-phosphate isomerase-like protein (cupin superfamily)
MTSRASLRTVAPLALLVAGCKDPAPTMGPQAAPNPAPAEPAQSITGTPSSASSAPPPKPIDGALPASAPHALDRRAECTKEGCALPHLVPDEVRPALSDGAPMVVWEHVVGERATLVFPRDEGVELAGVVLDGSLDLTPLEKPNAKTVGARWAAFRAPGGGVTLGGTGGKAVRVALAVAVAESGTSLGAHIDRRDGPSAPPSWTWKVRKKPIDVTSFTDRPDLAWGGGAYHARVGWDVAKASDHPALVLDLLRFSDDAAVAEHTHDHEWECLAVLDGDGALVRRPASGEDRVEARAGSIVTIPAGVLHAWKPSGKAPLFALQVYTPPGPEKRFEKLAGKASVTMGPQAAPNPAPPAATP